MAASKITLQTSLWYPTAAPTYNLQTLSASTHKLAFGFQAEDTATINALYVRMGTITGTTPNYEVALQGVDGSGLPDGSDVSGSTATFSPSSLSWSASSGHWITVSGASLTKGSMYALVIRYSSGTIDGSNNASFVRDESGVAPGPYGTVWTIQDTGSGYTKSTAAVVPVFGYRTSSNTWGLPRESASTSTAGTNGNRVACKLTLPSLLGSTYGPGGIIINSGLLPTGGTVKFGVWNAAGTALADSGNYDTDHCGSNGTRVIFGRFTSTPTLNFGTAYYFGIERVATVTPTVRTMVMTDTRDLESLPFGSGAILSTWDGSAWTDNTLQIPPITLLLDDWVKPSGSSVYLVEG